MFAAQGIETSFNVLATIFARNQPSLPWQVVSPTTTVSAQTLCFPYQFECFGLNLVNEKYINFPNYKIEVSIPNPGNTTWWMADVRFDLWTTYPPYSTEELVIRTIYAFVTAAVFCAWMFSMRRLKFSDWNLEQKFTFGFMISLFLLMSSSIPIFPPKTLGNFFFSFLEMTFFCWKMQTRSS